MRILENCQNKTSFFRKIITKRFFYYSAGYLHIGKYNIEILIAYTIMCSKNSYL